VELLGFVVRFSKRAIIAFKEARRNSAQTCFFVSSPCPGLGLYNPSSTGFTTIHHQRFRYNLI